MYECLCLCLNFLSLSQLYTSNFPILSSGEKEEEGKKKTSTMLHFATALFPWMQCVCDVPVYIACCPRERLTVDPTYPRVPYSNFRAKENENLGVCLCVYLGIMYQCENIVDGRLTSKYAGTYFYRNPTNKTKRIICVLYMDYIQVCTL